MRYLDIRKYFEKLKVLGVEDLKLLDDKFNKKKLKSWVKNGYLKNIRRGYYLYNDLSINEFSQYYISNKIYSPSYISLETALNYYSIIPEQTFVITSVGTNKTTNFDTEVGFYSYKKIKKSLFWGYHSVKIQDYKILIGDLEKVILDYLYLKPQIKDIEDFEGLRWNREELHEKLDINKLTKYAKIYNYKTLDNKIKILLKYIIG